jgi:membrane protein YdbS with pleckstrin-like domain
MSRIVLGIVGVLVALRGVASLIPSWTLATEPAWHSWAKIIVGVIALIIAISDSGE